MIAEPTYFYSVDEILHETAMVLSIQLVGHWIRILTLGLDMYSWQLTRRWVCLVVFYQWKMSFQNNLTIVMFIGYCINIVQISNEEFISIIFIKWPENSNWKYKFILIRKMQSETVNEAVYKELHSLLTNEMMSTQHGSVRTSGEFQLPFKSIRRCCKLRGPTKVTLFYLQEERNSRVIWFPPLKRLRSQYPPAIASSPYSLRLLRNFNVPF